MQGLFITATDTGVGKTEITAAIARIWRREGRSFAVCKPVATRPAADDTRRLALGGGRRRPRRGHAVRLRGAGRPARGGPPRGADAIARGTVGGRLASKGTADAVLVEGVGGLLCPLTDAETVADLAGGSTWG